MKVLISAGEASGDRLGAGLARALRARRPSIELLGMGGDEMAEAGVRLLQHASEVAVVGIVEVARHLPAIRRAMGRLTDAIARERPDLVVPIDFPDFNLRLAARSRSAGVPVVYYVSPQVWAWRRGRVRTIRRLVRRVLVLFPFEKSFYDDAGVPATFVGHPAAAARTRASRGELLPALGLDPRSKVLALLPGSRVGEAGRMLPVQLDAARLLRADDPTLQLVVPRARTIPRGLLEAIARERGVERLAICDDRYPDVLEASDAGIVASGTATLDAALAELPFVAVYRMQPMTYWIARSLVSIDHVALPNLVAGARIVPELVQDDCRAETIAAAVAPLLSDPVRAAGMREALGGVRSRLMGDGAFDRAAEAVLAELERKQV